MNRPPPRYFESLEDMPTHEELKRRGPVDQEERDVAMFLTRKPPVKEDGTRKRKPFRIFAE